MSCPNCGHDEMNLVCVSCGWTVFVQDDEPMAVTRGEVERLRKSLTRIWEEAYDCQSEDRWGTYPLSLFRVIGEEITALGLPEAKS